MAADGFAAGVPALLDFEDLTPGTAVHDQYEGAVFVGGDTLNPDGSQPITIGSVAATVSPTRVLLSDTKSSDGSSPPVELTITFDVVQDRVVVSSGLREAYAAPRALAMEALGSDLVSIVDRAVTPCLGIGPTSFTSPLAVSGQDIHAVRLVLVHCASFEPIAAGAVARLGIDNLLYRRPRHGAAADTEAPAITIASPAGASTVTAWPGSPRTTVHGEVVEIGGVATLSLRVNGGPQKQMGYFCGGTSTCRFQAAIDAGDGLTAGPNTVSVTAYDVAGNRATQSVSFAYAFAEAAPGEPGEPADIVPVAYQVTQAIDFGPISLDGRVLEPGTGGFSVSHDATSAVPLIAGKATLIRVFGGITGEDAAESVPAHAQIRRTSCTEEPCDIAVGVAPVGAGGSSALVDGITVHPLGTAAADPEMLLTDASATWNFLIPQQWSRDDITVTIHINDGDFAAPLAARDAREECAGCRDNDRIDLRLVFQDAGTMVVDEVRYAVTSDEAETAAQEWDVDALFRKLGQWLPSQVVRGRRYHLSADSPLDAEALLFRTSNIDGADPHRFILGLVPDSDHALLSSSGDAIGGDAWIGRRGAVANVRMPGRAARGLGHDIGLPTTDCAAGQSQHSYCEFPITGGATGVVASDLDALAFRRTGSTFDFMGETDPAWVSWYTYDLLSTHDTPGSLLHAGDHAGHAAVAAQASMRALHPRHDTLEVNALLVRSRVSAAGQGEILPVFRVRTIPHFGDRFDEILAVEDTSADPLQSLEFLDGQGNVLDVHNFDPFRDSAGTDLHGHELVPIPSALGRITLRRGGVLLAELTHDSEQTPTVRVTEPATGTTWQAGTRRTIRWTASSPTGRPLSAQVSYGVDNFTTVPLVLARDVTGNELEVSVDDLPASGGGFVFLEVSDGLNRAFATRGGIIVEGKTPTVRIVSPHQPVVSEGVPVTLAGVAADADGLQNAAYHWHSDIDGDLGEDATVTVRSLSRGRHTITLSVTDGSGKIGQDFTTLEVYDAELPALGFRDDDAAALDCNGRVLNLLAKLHKKLLACRMQRRSKGPGIDLEGCELAAMRAYDARVAGVAGCRECTTQNLPALRAHVAALAADLAAFAHCAASPTLADVRCETALLKMAGTFTGRSARCRMRSSQEIAAGGAFVDARCEARLDEDLAAFETDFPACSACIAHGAGAVAPRVRSFLDEAAPALLFCDGVELLADPAGQP